jgi:hypothetical protein
VNPKDSLACGRIKPFTQKDSLQGQSPPFLLFWTRACFILSARLPGSHNYFTMCNSNLILAYLLSKDKSSSQFLYRKTFWCLKRNIPGFKVNMKIA